jgi:hypothetical protein
VTAYAACLNPLATTPPDVTGYAAYLNPLATTPPDGTGYAAYLNPLATAPPPDVNFHLESRQKLVRLSHRLRRLM